MNCFAEFKKIIEGKVKDASSITMESNLKDLGLDSLDLLEIVSEGEELLRIQFEDEELFTAISDSPNINNLKNDFAIWGTRKSATGDDLPIHARYAIDKKPIKYMNLEKTLYTID